MRSATGSPEEPWLFEGTSTPLFSGQVYLLATEACQVQDEDAYYGHLVLRLLAGLVLRYTARVLFKGRVTMEAIVCSLKHHWRFIDSERLELQALSWDLDPEAP